MPTPKRDRESFKRFYAYVDECGLVEVLKGICAAHHVTLADAYLDARGPTVHAARLECWWWLRSRCRKSEAEIAVMWDRDRSSIHYALGKLDDEARRRGVAVAADTARVLAVGVAENTAERISAAGRRQAALNGAGRASSGAREAPGSLSASGTGQGPVRAKTKP